MYFPLVSHTAFSRYSSNFYALEQTHGSRERQKIRGLPQSGLFIPGCRVKYFQIFPPLVFSYRLLFFTNRGSFQVRTWVWRKLQGCFHHWSLGWYICYLKTQITVIKEKRRVWFFINRLDFFTWSWRGTWLFRLSSRSNAFLDEILRLNETLFLPLRTTRRSKRAWFWWSFAWLSLLLSQD